MQLLPLHDLPTRSASGYLIRYVLPRSAPPQLVGPLDRKAPFSTLAIGDVIIGVGHGSPSDFCGHNNEVILDVQSIPNVQDKVIILISCETAQMLGPELIYSGAISYIGFKKDLVWVLDADSIFTPWSDKIAVAAMMPIVDCVNSILDGQRTGEAFTILNNGLLKNAETEEDELVKACLKFNQRNAVLLGDPEARIRARPKITLPIPPPPLLTPIRP